MSNSLKPASLNGKSASSVPPRRGKTFSDGWHAPSMRSIIGGTITTILMLGVCAALAAYFQSRGEELVARLLWVYLIASIIMIGAVGGIIFVWVGLARSHRASIIVGLIAGGLSFATLIVTIAWAVKMDVIARQ